MMPEEWPIAAREPERNSPARVAGRTRLSTVRTDFFMDPAERLSEQERALMTAMLHRLIGNLAVEVRAAGPEECQDLSDQQLVRRLVHAGLLDSDELVGLLLRRADEERIASAAQARSGRQPQALQSFTSSDSAPVAANALALVLARARRRDRFSGPLVTLDDLGSGLAERLAYGVAAALRARAEAASGLLRRHDPTRSLEALTQAFASEAERAGLLDDAALLTWVREGELLMIAAVVAGRAGTEVELAFDALLSGDCEQLVRLLRAADCSRAFTAGLLATVGDLIGIADAADAIGRFDAMSDEEARAASEWLAAPQAYRAVLQMLGGADG